jgi:hypothetical protein
MPAVHVPTPCPMPMPKKNGIGIVLGVLYKVISVTLQLLRLMVAGNGADRGAGAISTRFLSMRGKNPPPKGRVIRGGSAPT